jgi:predicted aspartyl protease
MIRSARSFGMRWLGPICLAMAVSASPAGAAEHCELESFAQLPVTMEGLRPIVRAKINGIDAGFVVDSGAFFSMLGPAAPKAFGLPMRAAPFGLIVGGVKGSTQPEVATVRTLTLANYPLHRVDFLVGENEFGAGAVGILGENLIRTADVEYDFSQGVLRLIKPEHCGDRPLAYWASASEPFGTVDLRTPTRQIPQPIGSASVNGVVVRVLFDTGSPTSELSLAAARRAGITPNTPGVVGAGVAHGLGHLGFHIWVAPVRDFKIGGEEIKHTHLVIGDFRFPDADMLIGTDFFLAHRIYVANSQDKLYFTYNGGPVFDTSGMMPRLRFSRRAAMP